MAILGFELEEIERLLRLLEARGLDELILEEEGRSLRIRGPRPPKRAQKTAALPSPPASAPLLEETPPARKLSPAKSTARCKSTPKALPVDQIALVAPMVGTFYRSEKPGASPLIEIGQYVAVNQTIGIIEAMKIFSEIPAEQAGTVVAIPAQDGQLVQTGMPLMILRKE